MQVLNSKGNKKVYRCEGQREKMKANKNRKDEILSSLYGE